MATHSLVTMPVLSHSQKRKKCDGMRCRSIARCAWARCRKIVTLAMVMWVVTSVYSRTCHQDRFHRPLASQSTAAFSTAQSGSRIFRGLLSLSLEGSGKGPNPGQSDFMSGGSIVLDGCRRLHAHR